MQLYRAEMPGPLKDNTGKEQVKSGDYLKDDYIAGKLNWYVDNVEAK